MRKKLIDVPTIKKLGLSSLNPKKHSNRPNIVNIGMKMTLYLLINAQIKLGENLIQANHFIYHAIKKA